MERENGDWASFWHRLVCPTTKEGWGGIPSWNPVSELTKIQKKWGEGGCSSIASEGLLTVRTANQPNKQKTRLLYLLSHVSRCHPQSDIYHLPLFHDPCSSGRTTNPVTTKPLVDLWGMHTMLTLHPPFAMRSSQFLKTHCILDHLPVVLNPYHSICFI